MALGHAVRVTVGKIGPARITVVMLTADPLDRYNRSFERFTHGLAAVRSSRIVVSSVLFALGRAATLSARRVYRMLGTDVGFPFDRSPRRGAARCALNRPVAKYRYKTIRIRARLREAS
jgi:hypothetical protein